MRRRSADPLVSKTFPVARLAAVGLVAAGGLLAAQQLTGPGPTFRGATAADSGSNERAGDTKAKSLLDGFRLPPGSSRLNARPSTAPSQADSLTSVPETPDLVIETGWWSSALSPGALASWLQANPPAGLTDAQSWTYGGGGSTYQLSYEGFGTGAVDQITVFTNIFTLPDGKTTGLQLSALVTYRPDRPPQEQLPAAARLAVQASLPDEVDAGGPTSMTVTDQAMITRVENLIDGLPTFPPGNYSCPNDTGGGLDLTFESSAGATLAQVHLAASGCDEASVTVGGQQEPALTAGLDTVQAVQAMIGTHWQLTPNLP